MFTVQSRQSLSSLCGPPTHQDLLLCHSLLTILWERFKGHLLRPPRLQGIEGSRVLERAVCLSFSERFPLKTCCRLFRCSYAENELGLRQPFVSLLCSKALQRLPAASGGHTEIRGKWRRLRAQDLTLQPVELCFGLLYILGRPIKFKVSSFKKNS